MEIKQKVNAFEVIIGEYENYLYDFHHLLKDKVHYGFKLDDERQRLYLDLKNRIKYIKPLVHNMVTLLNDCGNLTNKQISLFNRIKGLEKGNNDKLKILKERQDAVLVKE